MAKRRLTTRGLRARYRRCKVDAQLRPVLVTSISAYFDHVSSYISVTGTSVPFWFRGHASLTYKLVPSALRYSRRADREKALALLADFRRFATFRLAHRPSEGNPLEWMGIAQHYGVPTRLMDWTVNPAAALYFACSGSPKEDGLVAVLNPLELNARVAKRNPRVFDPQTDARIVAGYLRLDGQERRVKGKATIAIAPTFNSERIVLQRGAFTLHGSHRFELDRKQAATLSYIPILKDYKQLLLNQLERIGVDEMSLFPEPEHVARQLKRSSGLLEVK